MPIYKGTLKTGAAYKGSTSLSRIYKGAYLVFEAFQTLIAEGVPPLTLLNCAAEIMLGYRIYGNSKQGELPSGYTQLEYIEATGTQYVDTGFSPDSTTRVDYKVETTAGDFDASPFIGARLGINNNNRFFPIGYLNVSDMCRTSYGLVTHNIPVSGDTVLEGTFRPSEGFTIINGTSYDISNSSFTKSDNNNLYLFATSGYSGNLYLSHGKMYYCKIYNNGTLVRNYIPAKNSSNVVGMYDLVNGVFYQNAGTGTFTAGANAPTPNAPIEIESVGDKTKNLWNSTLIGGCMKFADGQYLPYPGYVCNSTPIPVEAGEIYTISANNYDDPDLTSSGFVFYNNGSFVSSLITTSLTVTIPSGVNQLYYNFRKQSDPSTLEPSDITNVQLEKGSSATSYEPYGYKIPITVSGRNVIDMTDAYLDFNEPVSMWASTVFNFTKVKKYFKPNTTYTISYDVECTYVPTHTEGFDNRYGFFLYSGVSGYPSIIMYQYGYLSVGDKNSYILTFTTPANLYDNAADYRILGYSNLYKNGGTNASSSMQFSNIQIVEGSYTAETMPKYEPYVTPTSTNIYLDAPLRKIGSGTPQALPDGYTQLEYIESTGTQYIDTGIILTNQDLISIKFSNSIAESYSVFGANDGTNRCQFFYTNKYRYMRTFVPTNLSFGIGQVDYGVAAVYYLDLKNRRYKINNKPWVNDDTSYEGTPQLNTYLFAQNNSGEVSGVGTMKIYEYSVSRNGVEIQHLVPAKNSSGVVGMYDTIGNTFLTNQGTGTFNSAQSMYYDYIDFETQKVYRNVGSIDLGELTYTYQDNIARFRSSTIPNLKIVQGNWTYDLMCDIYGTTLAQNFNIGAQGGAAFIWDNRYTDATALENAIKGYYLIYALNTPTEASVTLPSILLNKGTNIVSVGTSLKPSNMWIKYKGKA